MSRPMQPSARAISPVASAGAGAAPGQRVAPRAAAVRVPTRTGTAPNGLVGVGLQTLPSITPQQKEAMAALPSSLQDAQTSDEDNMDVKTPRIASKDPDDKGYDPASVPRECTDWCWIIPFVILLAGFAVVTRDAVREGDLTRLFTLPDLNGNLCGHGLNRDKPFLYFCMQQSSEWEFQGNRKRLDMANPICVGICPGTYNTSSRCWLPLNQTYAWVQDYPTQPYITLLCRPSRVFTQSIYDQFQDFLLHAPPVASISMMYRSWQTLLWSGVVALACSYLYIAALSFCANCIMVVVGQHVVSFFC